jgi:hypothetical protein
MRASNSCKAPRDRLRWLVDRVVSPCKTIDRSRSLFSPSPPTLCWENDQLSAPENFFVENAGLISAVLGFLSAIVLGIPAVREIRERRHWDALSKTVNEQAERAAATGVQTNVLAQFDDVQWNFVKDRMGSYLAHRRTIICGLSLLAISFGFDIVDNIEEQRTQASLTAPPPAR